MADQEVVQASTYVWMRNRELSPLYERLVIVGGSLECLALIKELLDVHRKQVDDCHELLAVVGVEIPGEYKAIDVRDDVQELMQAIWVRENEAMEDGWIRVDRHVKDEMGRTVVIRGTGRQDRKLRLIREISIKCKITLTIEHTTPQHPHHPPHHPGPGPMPPAPPVGGAQEYVVQPGDTMYLIAGRYGISLDALIRANPQIRNPDTIYPGEVLRIPVGSTYPPGGHMPSPPPMGGGGGGGARRYVVIEGETIEIVARKFGMNVTELTAFNPQISPPYTLTVGQVLFVPSPGAVG